MVVDIMNLVNTALSSCSQLFLRIFNASGMIELYISIIFIVLAFKFILSPVIGHRGSDTFSKKNNKSSSSGDSDG